MVKVGLIVEGESERIVINSQKFNTLLNSINLLNVVCINANGNGNLLPKNIEQHINTCRQKGATKIIVLVDSEGRTNTEIYDLLKPENDFILIIEIQSLESWLLADSKLLSKVFNSNFAYDSPKEIKPDYFQTVNNIFIKQTEVLVNPNQDSIIKWLD